MKKSLFLLLLGLITLGACTPSEEDAATKRRSVRAENLQRYMNKAQEIRSLARLRAKPIVVGPLVNSSAFTALLPETRDTRLSVLLSQQKGTLEETVRAAAAYQAGEKADALLNQFREETVAGVRGAKTPQELAAKIKELNEKYTQKLAELAQAEEKNSWNVPTEKQSDKSYQMLKNLSRSLHDAVARDYGPKCAQKADALLNKTADDYRLMLSSVNEPEETAKELERLGTEADDAFNALVKEYGDPLVSLSKEQAANLRAQLISAHQQVEIQFEKLYGKEAVLQTRTVFEKYKDALDSLVQKPGRLSQTKEQMDRLGLNYREALSALQVRLNGEMERRAATARGIPLASAAK